MGSVGTITSHQAGAMAAMEVLPESSAANVNTNVMSMLEYQEQHWGRLREAIDKMFDYPPGSYKPISYEEMYSAVYKCVCKQFSEKLYHDLINHVRTRVAEWSRLMHQVPDEQLVEKFHDSLVQYFHALGGIVPIFTYMNRFYIETKLKTSLQTELLKVFSSMFSDVHVKRLIPLMAEAQSRPFSVRPDFMATICKYLHQLNTEYSTLNPCLFQHYLPNVGPAMTEADIERQISSEKMFQEQLRQQGWNDSSRGKRGFEDEALTGAR